MLSDFNAGELFLKSLSRLVWHSQAALEDLSTCIPQSSVHTFLVVGTSVTCGCTRHSGFKGKEKCEEELDM